MRVKLTQPGWETYTGQMGVIFFEGGMSNDHVSTRDAVRLAACVNCEWEDGSNLSPTHELLMVQNNAAPVVEARQAGSEEPVAPAPKEEEGEVRIYQAVVSGPKPEAPLAPEAPVEVEVLAPAPVEAPAAEEGEEKKFVPRWTQEQLEGIADKEGIAGLRALGDPLDIKARSITELMEALSKVPAVAE